MKLVPYLKYKPSGAEWLGEIPEHWDVKRGRFCMRVNPRSDGLRRLNPEDEVSFVPMEAVGEYGGLSLDQTRAISDIGPGYTEFDDGDILVAKITPCFENGKGAVATHLLNSVAFATTELHVLRSAPNLEPHFLFYFTVSRLFRGIGEGEMSGAGGQKRVPSDFCRNIHVPLPNVEEQRAIADFLGRETGKIDSLVAKKQTLIERLKEKRIALISRTVTRGLPPDAACGVGLDPHPKFKPTGSDWLGDVPEHWDVKRGRFCMRVNPRSDGLRRLNPEDEVSFVPMEAVGEYGGLSLDQTRAISDIGPGYTEFDDGDILVAKITPCFENGKGAVATHLLNSVAFATTELHVLRSAPNLEPHFLFYFTVSRLFRGIGEGEMSGAGGQKRVPSDFCRNIHVPLPNVEEQRAIADFLGRETAKIDTIVAWVEAAIERLQEYRAALITAAVTGKIDVFGIAPPVSEPSAALPEIGKRLGQ